MNFSYPTNSYWFIPKNYKKISELKLIEVETYKDSVGVILALKRNSFIGIFDSINELNQIMETENYLNIESLGLNKKIGVKEVGEKIIHLNKNLNKVEFYFVDDGYCCPPIFNQSFLINQNFIKAFKKTKKAFLEFTGGKFPIDANLKLNSEKYLTIDLLNWDNDERNLLYTNSFEGVYYYYNKYSKRKSFDFGTYNSIIQSINGQNTIQIYKESIKWFSNSIKQKLKQNNYEFPELRKPSNSYYNNSGETFNDTFYNDQLDMDQQGPEFWDSL
jgi:hypothetical protein